MKKKLLMGISVMLLFGITSLANATPIDSTYDWNASGTFKGRTYQEIGNNSNLFTYEWNQTITFDPVAVQVNWASLTLSYVKNSQTINGEIWFLSGNNSAFLGNLVRAQDDWNDHSFDIASLFNSFPSSSFTLSLKLTENTTGADKIYLDKSVISGDYTGVSPAPVPEPATMLLMGTGLAGIVASRYRKAKKNS